jgi:hypothetical protein
MRWPYLAPIAVVAAVALRCASTDAGADDGGTAGGGAFHLDAAIVPVCDAGDDAASDAAASGDASCTPSRTDVHFAADVRPILASCRGEVCHSQQWGGPDPWPTLVGRPAVECCDGRKLVDPGDPDGSYVLDKVEDHDLCTGRRMPLDQAALAPADVQTLYDWICLGALDD